MFKSSKYKSSSAKVVIIGEAAVGKTSLRKKFIGQGFRKEHMMTIGTDFSQKLVVLEDNQKSIELQIWDLASDVKSEKVRRKKYLKNATGAILVFDLSRSETFLKLNYWLNELFLANPKSKLPILIVGNKCDLIRQRDILQEDVIKFVEHLIEDKTIKSSWIDYIETSAKSGFNVDNGFQIIAEAIAKKS